MEDDEQSSSKHTWKRRDERKVDAPANAPAINRESWAGLGWAGTTIFPKVKSNDSGVDAHLVSDVSLPLRGFHVASFKTARDWLLLLRLRLLLKFPFVCMYVYTRPTSSKSHRRTSWSLGLPVTLLIRRR